LEAFDAIVRTLRGLENDETCWCSPASQSCVPHQRMGTARADRELESRWRLGELGAIPQLEAQGLMMYGQMTAGSWIYIGTQGILQGTYETFGAIAKKSSAARWQAPSPSPPDWAAGRRAAAGRDHERRVAICVDCDETRIDRRIEHRYLDARPPISTTPPAGRRGPRRQAAVVDRCSATPPRCFPSFCAATPR